MTSKKTSNTNTDGHATTKEDSIIGHFKDGVFYVDDISSITVPVFKKQKNANAPEKQIDNDCKDNLLAIGFNAECIFFDKTNIKNIDKHIPTKSLGGGKGKLDVFLLQHGDIQVLIEDKVPTTDVSVALNEAIYYCDGLICKNASDVRIAIGFNGREVKWRVRIDDTENGTHTWQPFLISGVECTTFPTPAIVSLIYTHNNLSRINEDRSQKSKQMLDECISTLKQKYRQLGSIQNDNHTAIDFTVAFISLKSILEKYGSIIPKSEYKWSGLPGKNNEELKENIKSCVAYICDTAQRKNDSKQKNIVDLALSFGAIFYQKTSNRTFDFKGLISEFIDQNQLDSLRDIYLAIDELPPLHSSKIDLFGETYELLADKKTKSAFGQYFTGRHIIRPLVKLLLEDETSNSITGGVENGLARNPKKICDPACGTGGFLTEAFKYINNLFSESIDVNDFSSRAIYGYDIFPENITKTKINLYLAGDGFSEMESINTLTGGMDEKFDYIVTNPPYGDGQITVDSSVINNNRLDVNFVIKIVKMLTPGGKALIIIPDGILEAPSLADLREWLIKECKIDKIIGLPVFSFAPYTKEKTYALYITKRNKPLQSSEESEKAHERVWFYIIDNDGYVNSDKRFPTKRRDNDGRWLHDELSDWADSNGDDHDCWLLERWKRKEQNDDESFYDEFGVKIEGKKFGWVSMDKIRKQQSVSYNSMPTSKVLKLISDKLKQDGKLSIKKKVELFDDGKLKSSFCDILTSANIEWDSIKQCFVDKGKHKTAKLLNLLPEKYLRETQSDYINFVDFKEIIDCKEDEVQKIFISKYVKISKKKTFPENYTEQLKSILNVLRDCKSKSIVLNEEFGVAVSDIFSHKQGHQITDEELYNTSGNVPVISGADAKIKGFSSSSYVQKEDIPCLSYQTKGNNNLVIHIQSDIFDANNTAVLIPKTEWRGCIDLEYVIPKLARNMADLKTSNDGVSYIDTRILETVIGLPVDKCTNKVDLQAQKNVVAYLKKMELLESKIIFMINDN